MSALSPIQKRVKLDAFIFRLALLLLPGIVGSTVYRKLRGRVEKEAWEDFAEVLLFSLLSYGVLAGVVEGAGWARRELWPRETSTASAPATQPAADESPSVLRALVDEKAPPPWREILYASAAGLVMAFIGSWVHRKRWINRLGYVLRVTQRDGDADVWTLFHETNAVSEWAMVRDYKANVCYYGHIRRYSGPEKSRELVLENVDVYKNDTGEHLYARASLYVSREAEDLAIEYEHPPATIAKDSPGAGKPQENHDGRQQAAEQDDGRTG